MNELMRRRRSIMGLSKSEYWETSAKYWKLIDLTTNNKACQGACFYKSGSYCYWYYFVVTNDNATQYLYRASMTAGTNELLATFTTLSHANSMSCDQGNGVFYVASMDASLGVIKVDAETYETLGSFQVTLGSETAYVPYALAFDRKRSLLYVRYSDANNKACLAVYTTAGVFVRSFEFETGTGGGTTGQGLETDGEYLYYCRSSSNCINVYSLDGKFQRNIELGITEEFEELIYDWDGGFYTAHFLQGGTQRIYSVLFRSFKNKLRLSFIAPLTWSYNTSTGTIGRWGYYSFTFKSTAAKNYNLTARSQACPYGYSFLEGKKCTVKFTLERREGSGGYMCFNIFTTTSQQTSVSRVYEVTKSVAVPASGTTDYSFSFVPGSDWFLPPSGQEGSYVGFMLFLYADSGNTCWVRNFKFEVEV